MGCQAINWVGDATMCAPMNLKSPRVSVPWHQPIPKIDLLLNQRHQHYFNSSTPMPDNHSRDRNHSITKAFPRKIKKPKLYERKRQEQPSNELMKLLVIYRTVTSLNVSIYFRPSLLLFSTVYIDDCLLV